MRVLITGWASFWHGVATAGDVMSMRRVDPDGPAVTGFHRVLARDDGVGRGRTCRWPSAPSRSR